MMIIKSIETEEQKVWIEQHNDYFVLKYQEKNKEVQALNAIRNLALVLDFFDTLIGRDHLMSN